MEENKRRKFIKSGLLAGMAVTSGAAVIKAGSKVEAVEEAGELMRVLTPEGKLVEVSKAALKEMPADASKDCKITPCEPAKGDAARKGIPGRSFVMVIDLAKCKNARKCIEGCQKGHDLMPEQEWMKVYLRKENPESDPFWFPKNCFHCDNPPCVKVCPVGATFKRSDNLVLVDSDRCIGCKFCISACPYSARILNWTDRESYKDNDPDYSPETSLPAQHGVVSKCDFCADRSREGKLPYCASSCPMGAIYFGDKNEDAVYNGEETLRFRQLITERTGYRYLEELGTKPNVYYLPPVNRMFPYERGFNNLSEEKMEIIKKSIAD